MSSSSSALQAALRVVCPSVEVTDRGLTLPNGITEVQAEQVSTLLFDVEELSRFLIGDFLNGLERIFREGWTQFVSEKLSKRAGTIDNWRYTCRNVPLAIRRNELSMSSHYAVAGLKSQTLQVQLLRIAVEDELPSDDLSKFANLFKPLAQDDQDEWASEIKESMMDAGELLAAYNAIRDAQATTSTIEEDVQPEPFQPTLQEHIGNRTVDTETGEITYSGEAGDYDWTDEKPEEPGALVSLKIAIEELYFSSSQSDYARCRSIVLQLLQELDEERNEQLEAVSEF